MLSLILQTTLILHQVVISTQLYDCIYLRSICEIDPECGDQDVFYSKCESYHDKRGSSKRGTNEYRSLYIKKGSLNDDNLINKRVNVGSRDKRIGNVNNVYSDYQREALRESLYLLKRKLHDRNTGVNHNIGKDINDATSSNVDKNNDKPNDKPNDNNKLSNNINNSNDNRNRPKHLDAKKRQELITKYISARGREVGSSKDVADDGTLQADVRKKDLIDKAFDLVQSLINEHDQNGIALSLTDDANTEKVKRKVGENFEEVTAGTKAPSGIIDNDTVTADKREIESDQSDIRTGIEDSSFDDKYTGGDNIGIATPVYGGSDSLEEEQQRGGENNVQDPEQLKEVQNKQDRGLVVLNASAPFSHDKAVAVGKTLPLALWNITREVFQLQRVDQNTAVYLMQVDPSWFSFKDDANTVVEKINSDKDISEQVKLNTGTAILNAVADSAHGISSINAVPPVTPKGKQHWDKLTLFSVIVAASVLLLLSVAIGVVIVKRKGKDFTPLLFRKNEAMQDYQELCRTQMSIVNSPHPDEEIDKNQTMKSWNDDQSPYNMDITTGHVILSYMEDHLNDENRLTKEWEALCAYKADDCSTTSGSDAKHATKNRYRDVLPYDHNRVKLREMSNAFHSDYINASFITDTNPKTPSYIATQGPLDNTVADFWQMIWEQGVVVIINLTRLSDMGLPQCHHYWPSDGSEIYHIYEVHLISEHIWCDDYLVRSLYLKNLQTAETRTVTQFHYLTWPDLSVPTSPGPLLEFRRKVNKCYRGLSCPVVVHCNNGVGRTGTYILLDMVLNRMIKGTKEIDIAATLEHLRDQRQDVVKTKGQFEFSLLAVAQEVSTILDAVAK